MHIDIITFPSMTETVGQSKNEQACSEFVPILDEKSPSRHEWYYNITYT